MRIALLLLSFLVAQPVWARTCANDYGSDCGDAETSAGTCETLGYSTTDVEDCPHYLRCPFNSSYKRCVQGPAATEPVPDRQCQVGWVFYSDGTCGDVADYNSGSSQIPVGVVYYVTAGGAHGKIISLKDLTSRSSDYTFDPANPYNNTSIYIPWGLYNTTIDNLTNYASLADLNAGLVNGDAHLFNGGVATDIIINTPPSWTGSCSGSYANTHCQATAAKATRLFYPPYTSSTDRIVGAGHWYMPSVGEWALLYGYNFNNLTDSNYKSGATGTNKIIVNATLSALKSKGATAEPLANDWYLASAKYNTKYSWKLNMADGERNDPSLKRYYQLRAGLDF